MYAIIQTGGKQYKVAEGDVVTVEKLEAAEGDTRNKDNGFGADMPYASASDNSGSTEETHSATEESQSTENTENKKESEVTEKVSGIETAMNNIQNVIQELEESVRVFSLKD